MLPQELFCLSNVDEECEFLTNYIHKEAAVNHMQIRVDKIISLCIKLHTDKNIIKHTLKIVFGYPDFEHTDTKFITVRKK